MSPRPTPVPNPRPTRLDLLASAFILIAVAARPAAAVTGLVEANGKAVTTFAGCKRSARPLTLPVRFLSDSQWQASLGAATPSGTYAAISTRRITTIPFTLDAGSRIALQAELQARATAACGRSIVLQSITVRAFRGRINARRGTVKVRLLVALGGTGTRARGAFRFNGQGPLGPLPTTTTTTSTSTSTSTSRTTSTLPSCTQFVVEGCPPIRELEGLDERTNDEPESAVPVSIGSRFEGTIGNVRDDGADSDYFKFNATRGDHLRVTVSNRAGGTFQAGGRVKNSGSYLVLVRPGTPDPSIATREFYIPETGEYVVDVRDLRNLGFTDSVGGSTFTYRVDLTRVARLPTPVTLPLVNLAGSVPATGEITLLGFTAAMGTTITASTRAERLPSPSRVDTMLLLFDASTAPPTLLALNDDIETAPGLNNTDSAVGAGAPTTGPYLLVVDHYDVDGVAADDRRWDVSLAANVTECLPGAHRACYEGPGGTEGTARCHAGEQTCSSVGAFGPCAGQVLPRAEFCNALDDDCDGAVDNACTPGEHEGPSQRNNDTPDTAVPISIGIPFEGTIGTFDGALGEDQDVFAFDAVRGDRLRVTLSARSGTEFHAFGSLGAQAGAIAIVRPGTSDRAVATREFYVRESGEHFLGVRDLRNTEDEDAEAGGPTFTYAGRIDSVNALPSIVTPALVDQPGSVPDTGEVTAFLFTATMGDSLMASTRATRLSPPSTVDTVLLLFDMFASPPTLLASNDDLAPLDHTDSELAAIAPRTGPYLLVVDHYDVVGLTPDARRWEVSLTGSGFTTTSTSTSTTTTSSTTSTIPVCTEFHLDEGCPAASEGEGVDERTNDTLDSAVPIAIGSRIDGTIGNLTAGDPDPDVFRFHAVAGDHLRLTIANRAGGSFQALGDILTPSGTTYRRSRPGTSDGSIATREFAIFESGDYLLRVNDLRNDPTDAASPRDAGGPTFTYRMELTRVDRAPEPVELPVSYRAGNVPVTGDVTAFTFAATAGETLTASMRADRLPSPSKVDTYLMLFDTATTPPTPVAFNDDGPGTFDSELALAAPTTSTYLLVADYYNVASIEPRERVWDLSIGTGPPCANQVRNGDETDVDCGGSVCSACPLTKGCAQDGDCISGSCKPDHACGCPSTLQIFTATSNTAPIFEVARWPGGTQTVTVTPECSLTILNPDGGVDPLSSGNPFAVLANPGFATCVGTGGEDGDGCQPISCPPFGVGFCSQARPICSLGINGQASAQYTVQCTACSHPCRADQLCTNDTCQCPAGKANCGNACVDLNTDPGNCGACGTACAGGQSCKGGRCAF